MSHEPLLDYSVHTVPYPIRMSPQSGDRLVARMLIIVSNGGQCPVSCRKIHLRLEIGALAQNLTDIGKSMRASVTPYGKWEAVYDQDGHFTFTPRRVTDRLIRTEGLTFCLDNIYVNQQTGTYRLQILEQSKFSHRNNDCDDNDNDDDDYKWRPTSRALAKFPHFLVENA